MASRLIRHFPNGQPLVGHVEFTLVSVVTTDTTLQT